MSTGLALLIAGEYSVSDNRFKTPNGTTVYVVTFLTLLWILRRRWTRKITGK